MRQIGPQTGRENSTRCQCNAPSSLFSAINAVVRKVFNFSSNAYREVQWHLFAATFLLYSAYTLLNGEYVKLDKR